MKTEKRQITTKDWHTKILRRQKATKNRETDPKDRKTDKMQDTQTEHKDEMIKIIINN